MRLKNTALLVLLLVAFGGFFRWQFATSDAPTSNGVPVAGDMGSRERAELQVRGTTPERQESARRSTPALLAYSQDWNRELSPPLAAFREWTERYRAPSDRAVRDALEQEGLMLAQSRRTEMLAVIKTDPQRALAITVPAVVRQSLPASVLDELESRIAGVGDFATSIEARRSLAANAVSRISRSAFIGGTTYEAHVDGRRRSKPTKEKTPLHGIVLDGQLALHESPMRVVEPGEALAAPDSQVCPVWDLVVEPRSTDMAADAANIGAVEAQGRIWEFCGGMGMIEQFVSCRALRRAAEQCVRLVDAAVDQHFGS